MNWRKPVIRALLRLSRTGVLGHLRTMLALERARRDELLVYQRRRLLRLLMHAHANVPYYRRLLSEAGVVKDGAVRLEALRGLPPLTKQVIRERWTDLHSPDHRRRGSYEYSSGGSTGEPVHVLQDREFWAWNIANKLYYKTFGGQQIGEKELRLWGSERDLLQGRESLRIRLRNWLYNRVEVNAFRMSEADMRAAIETLNRERPTWVEAYAEAMDMLARYARANNLPVHPPRGVLTSAGRLEPEMREAIEEAFSCKVFDRYGAREVGDMACSCDRQEGLHLSVWNSYVEVLGRNMEPVGPGEVGTVYVTVLTNFSMPLVRYEIGDMAVPSERSRCACGRSTPLLDRVVGRTSGVFKTRDGRLVTGAFFTHLFRNSSARQYQLIQRDYDRIEVLVVPGARTQRSEFEQMERDIKKAMGPGCRVEFRFVDEIEPSPSGKHLFTISEVE